MRKNKLGNGSNGNIYSICMQSDLNKKMAMKEVSVFQEARRRICKKFITISEQWMVVIGGLHVAGNESWRFSMDES